MKYELLRLKWTGGSIFIDTTTPELIRQFLPTIKHAIPSAELTEIESKTLSGETWRFRLGNLKNREDGTIWWLIKTLGELGWEPLSVTQDHNDTPFTMYFRRGW
jgi:hypothetical protein